MKAINLKRFGKNFFLTFSLMIMFLFVAYTNVSAMGGGGGGGGGGMGGTAIASYGMMGSYGFDMSMMGGMFMGTPGTAYGMSGMGNYMANSYMMGMMGMMGYNNTSMLGNSGLSYGMGYNNNMAAMVGNLGMGNMYTNTNMYNMYNMNNMPGMCTSCGQSEDAGDGSDFIRHHMGNMYLGFNSSLSGTAGNMGMPLANAIDSQGVAGYMSGLGTGSPAFTSTGNIAAGYNNPLYNTFSTFTPYQYLYQNQYQYSAPWF